MPVFYQHPKIEKGVNIVTANSVDELPDPSTVPEGTIGLVPSEDAATTETEQAET